MTRSNDRGGRRSSTASVAFRRVAVAAGLMTATLLPAACSGGDGPGGSGAAAPSTTGAGGRLTADQAAAMANVLFDNYDAKGATFTAIAASTVTDERIELQGEIDWATHTGHALVAAIGAEAGVTEVYWRDDAVLERRPAFSDLLVTLSRPPADFVARPPDPVGRDLDRVLAIITGMASQQRDNPLLIQQTDGSTFLREDTLRGANVQVLRYGQRNVYWLDAGSGRLLRFEGNNATGNRPVIIDLIEHGPQTIAGPLVEQVVDVDQVRDIYDAAAVSPTPTPTTPTTTP